MRDHTFAASRFEETSLSTDTYLIGVITSGRISPVRCSNVRGFVGKFMRAAVEFAKGLSGGLHAAYVAERYYAMSDAELARVGLTRDRIPEEVRRMCLAEYLPGAALFASNRSAPKGASRTARRTAGINRALMTDWPEDHKAKDKFADSSASIPMWYTRPCLLATLWGCLPSAPRK